MNMTQTKLINLAKGLQAANGNCARAIVVNSMKSACPIRSALLQKAGDNNTNKPRARRFLPKPSSLSEHYSWVGRRK